MSGEPLASNLIRYKSVDSTSDEARRLILEGASTPGLPFVVWADRQTKGRGRSRKSWWSDDGSLTFTVALAPAACGLRPEHEPMLSLITALAILDTVDALGMRLEGIGIRWPNDVEVGTRKLAGILPEGVDTPSGRRILIGIGLNLSTRFDEAPAEVARMAASLAGLGLDVPAAGGPRRVLDLILEALRRLVILLASDAPGLAGRWDAVDLLRGCRVRIDLGPRIVAGTGAGIGPDGSLRIAPDDGGPALSLMGGQVLRDRPPV